MKKQKVVNVEVKRKSLKQRFLEGKISDLQEALLDETDYWHESSLELPPLHEYLGMNRVEYQMCLVDPDELETYWQAMRDLQ